MATQRATADVAAPGGPAPSPSAASRRTVLRAALGATLGAVATVAATAVPGRTADGDAVTAGQQVTEDVFTGIVNTSTGAAFVGFSDKTTGNGVGVQGESLGSAGTGVYGLTLKTSGTSIGVYGETRSTRGIGVFGLNAAPQAFPGGLGQTAMMGFAAAASGLATGVYGVAPSDLAIGVAGVSAVVGTAIPATTGRTGVFGFADVLSGTSAGIYGRAIGPNAIGVRGETTSTDGDGVFGKSSNGPGVHGLSISKSGGLFISILGNGLEVVGKVSFNRSGLVTIEQGTNQLLVDPGPSPAFAMSDATKVIVTLQSSAGIGVFLSHVARDTIAETFTIFLNKNCTKSTVVAWVMLD